jgi:hypothetical protein
VKIKILRKGGYAGIEQTLGSADIRETPKVAALLDTLAASHNSPTGADFLEYVITIEGVSGPRTLALRDPAGSGSPQEAALLQLMQALGVAP